MNDLLEWFKALAPIIAVLGGFEAFKYIFAPRITKRKAKAESDTAVNEAIMSTINAKDSVITSLRNDFDGVKAEVAGLRGDLAKSNRRYERTKTALVRHIGSWRASVNHPSVPKPLQDEIIGRIEPLPDDYDRDDEEGV